VSPADIAQDCLDQDVFDWGSERTLLSALRSTLDPHSEGYGCGWEEDVIRERYGADTDCDAVQSEYLRLAAETLAVVEEELAERRHMVHR
jgi:hypothetical protein